MSSIVAGVTSPALTAAGFVQMRQADWVSYLNNAWTAQFGSNVNLDPRSNNGQIIAIMSERFALLCELIEAVYQASYPAGATGVSVDNILALSGLQRLAARPTVTQPTPLVAADGTTQYGLVVLGTPGTVVPAATQISDTATPPDVFTIDNAVTIAAAANAVQGLVVSAMPTTGSYQLGITAPSGAQLTTAPIAYNAMDQVTQLLWATAPTSGTFTLSVGSTTTPPQPYNVTAAALASALGTGLGVSGVTATGSQSAGIVITWPAAAIPVLTPSTDASAPSVVNSVQSAINALVDSGTSLLPYTDVTVTGVSSWSIAFGANAASSGQPSSGAKQQPLITVASNTLQSGNLVVNLTLSTLTPGAPAQGIATATCTASGPLVVKALALNQIVTPVSGLTAVVNQLDCVPGAAVETDTQALQRRSGLLAAQAQGTLRAAIRSVSSVPGVTTALAFANTTNAAQQVITFASSPTAGTYQLFAGTSSTAAISGTAQAPAVQAALAALSGFSNVTVSGSVAYGFTVDFGGAQGGQAIPLMQVANNTTSVTVNVAYGRAPHSVELVVQGGSNTAVGQALYAALPSGIATYGAPVLSTTATVVAGSAVASVAQTTGLTVGLTMVCFGLVGGTTITQISGNNVTLSVAAISTYSNVPANFMNAALVLDSNNHPVLVQFSRPVPVPVYVALSIVTDTYVVPGYPASGKNPSALWSPGNVPVLQASIAAAVNAVPIGGTIVGMGTNGLLQSFGTTPGMYTFSMNFGTAPNPTSFANVQLLPEQQAVGSVQNIAVSYT